MLLQRPEIKTRLDEELVGWLTTVAPGGQPQSSPVWHVTDANDIIVYSRADATRLTNLAANSRVAYNLRGDVRGNHILTMEGTAQVDETLPGPAGNPAYLAKYETEMLRLGWSPQQYDTDFPVPIRIRLSRIRAF